MKRGSGTVDRRALEQRRVKVLVFVLEFIGAVLVTQGIRQSELWVGFAGMTFIVSASVLTPPRRRRAKRDPVQD